MASAQYLQLEGEHVTIGNAPDMFFLPMATRGRGQRLAVHHAPIDGASRGAVVYVHPFAEEMNKSRRMAALQSRAFARAGYGVVQIDLLGCGDSSGDFGDASWDDWVEDVVEACRWMRQHHSAPLTLWGLRAGCLLAVQAAQRIDAPVDFLFWQAPASGKTVLQQFLRLKLAAEIQEGSGKGVVDALRAQLAAGETIDVSGYRVAPALASGLEQARLEPTQHAGRVTWLEVSGRDAAALLPASASAVDRWRSAGHHVDARVVRGPAFWHSVEMEEAPALIEASTAAMATAVPA